MVIGEYGKNGGFTLITNLWQDNTIKNSNIIDSDSLNVAFLNLKKNCCKNLSTSDNETRSFYELHKQSCDADKTYFNENVPSSYYLFDHILDILIRRLNGDKEEIYPNVTLDEKGQERRERIEEISENIE